VFETLAGKYGKYGEKQKEIFFETFFWRIDKTNQVSMKTATPLIVVEYLDLTAHAVAQKEIATKREESRRDSKDKGADKF
jgi:hypothetical protein